MSWWRCGEGRGVAESVSMAWDSTHGEYVMRGEWKGCAVCGSPTNLGPVCRDLRCEIEHYEREGEGDD